MEFENLALGFDQELSLSQLEFRDARLLSPAIFF